MRIKMTKTMAGPKGAWSAGEVIEVSDEDGKELCRVGCAQVVTSPKNIETTEKRETEEVKVSRGRGRPSKKALAESLRKEVDTEVIDTEVIDTEVIDTEDDEDPHESNKDDEGEIA